MRQTSGGADGKRNCIDSLPLLHQPAIGYAETILKKEHLIERLVLYVTEALTPTPFIHASIETVADHDFIKRQLTGSWP